MQQRIRELQEQLMKGLRKVSEAPRGSQLQVVSSVSVDQSGSNAVAFRITNDPNAQDVVAIDRGRICPYRRKEVMAKLKERLLDGPVPTTHDLWAINKVYNIAQKDHFAWQPEYSSLQYSDAFVDWIEAEITNDPNFLHNARQKAYEMRHPA